MMPTGGFEAFNRSSAEGATGLGSIRNKCKGSVLADVLLQSPRKFRK
jgi:hypothetical protein